MKERMYEISIVTNEIFTFRKPRKFLKFLGDKLIEEHARYMYWIEYRIDENRFWYGESKPEVQDDGTAVYKTNYILTKNGLDDSVDIVGGILDRIYRINKANTGLQKTGMDFNTPLIQINSEKEVWHPNIEFYEQFDRDTTKKKRYSTANRNDSILLGGK